MNLALADVFTLHSRYALLVGHPPFETKSLRETYQRIRSNEYTIPSRISDKAARLIQKMLHAKPDDRPCLSDVLADDFFSKSFFPNSLPTTAIMTSPKWSEYDRRLIITDKKKESIKGITLAFTRQMKITPDEKQGQEEKACKLDRTEALQEKHSNTSAGSPSASNEEEDSGKLKGTIFM